MPKMRRHFLLHCHDAWGWFLLVANVKTGRDAFPFATEWNIVPPAVGIAVLRHGEGEVRMILRGLGLPGLAAVMSVALAGQAGAQEKAIAIELNKATNTDAGCRLTFVVKNDTQSLLEKTSYEIAAFDAAKTVTKLLVFEFGRLPAGKTKVVEFALAGVGCTDISRILVNTAPQCMADGSASTLCLDALKTSSLTPITFDQ